MKQLSKEELANIVYNISQNVVEKELNNFTNDVAKLDTSKKYNEYLVEALGLLTIANARICNETIIETISKLNDN